MADKDKRTFENMAYIILEDYATSYSKADMDTLARYLQKTFNKYFAVNCIYDGKDTAVEQCTDDVTTIKAKEIVYGEWIPKGTHTWPGGGTWVCSECGRQITFQCETPAGVDMNYCPGCGAKMDSKVG